MRNEFIGYVWNEEEIECIESDYINIGIYAPFTKENIFIINYLDEQIEEISKELDK